MAEFNSGDVIGPMANASGQPRRIDAPVARDAFPFAPSFIAALALNRPRKPDKVETKPVDSTFVARHPDQMTRALCVQLLPLGRIKGGIQTVTEVPTATIIDLLQPQKYGFNKNTEKPAITYNHVAHAVERIRCCEGYFETDRDMIHGEPIYNPYCDGYFEKNWKSLDDQDMGISVNRDVLQFKLDQRIINAWCAAEVTLRLDLDGLAMITMRQSLMLLLLYEHHRAAGRHPKYEVKIDELGPELDPEYNAKKAEAQAKRAVDPNYEDRTDENFNSRFVRKAVQELNHVHAQGGMRPWKERELFCAMIRSPKRGGRTTGFSFDLLSPKEARTRKMVEWEGKRRRKAEQSLWDAQV